jgi:hypothetical protein
MIDKISIDEISIDEISIDEPKHNEPKHNEPKHNEPKHNDIKQQNEINIKLEKTPTIIQPKETYLDNYYSKDFLKQYFYNV